MTKTCIKCAEEFDLKPGKPGFANVCPSCTTPIRPPTPVQRVIARDLSNRKPKSLAASAKSLNRAVADVVKTIEALDGKPDPVLRALAAKLRF